MTSARRPATAQRNARGARTYQTRPLVAEEISRLDPRSIHALLFHASRANRAMCITRLAAGWLPAETPLDRQPRLFRNRIDITLNWTYIAMPERAGNQHQVAGIGVQHRGEPNAERLNRQTP